jgi:hypothetical protein
MKRIYHPYWNWEDFKAGMWCNISKEEETIYLQKAINFTGNADLYGEWMLKVIEQWPIACEHNLSCTTMNRQAFIGHAACCLAIGCPEHITRLAWHQLTQDQQDRANIKADYAIKMWEEKYIENV